MNKILILTAALITLCSSAQAQYYSSYSVDTTYVETRQVTAVQTVRYNSPALPRLCSEVVCVDIYCDPYTGCRFAVYRRDYYTVCGRYVKSSPCWKERI